MFRHFSISIYALLSLTFISRTPSHTITSIDMHIESHLYACIWHVSARICILCTAGQCLYNHCSELKVKSERFFDFSHSLLLALFATCSLSSIMSIPFVPCVCLIDTHTPMHTVRPYCQINRIGMGMCRHWKKYSDAFKFMILLLSPPDSKRKNTL